MTHWILLLFTCLTSLTHGSRTHLPRIIFTEKETAVKRLPLPGHDELSRIIPMTDSDTVIGAGRKHLNSFNFHNHHETSMDIGALMRPDCANNSPKEDCGYNITVVHKRENQTLVFLCGTNVRETLCCDVNLSDVKPQCISSTNIENIKTRIKPLVLQEGQPSVFMESQESDLYVTYSGSGRYVGINKFGKHHIMPADHNKEQHYVGLVLSRQTNDMNSKVYGFFNEKNRDRGLNSDEWIPFVTRVCTNDCGGPKAFLQYRWTSQMNARLFCGDASSGQYFSELVDVATVHRDQDTTVYALFRNEWNMSAVCVYNIKDIENVFQTSPFKGTGNQDRRSRECVEDSTKIHHDVLNLIKSNSEMEVWVQPVDKTGPVLVNHHIYTHIRTDRSHGNKDSRHTVLFLSLQNGGIHKVIQTESRAFVIAEYRIFNQRTHNVNIDLHPSSNTLYASSRNELVQVDVANCTHYGDSCKDCLLARDPYCYWNGNDCTPTPHDEQDATTLGDHNDCRKVLRHSGAAQDVIELAPRSKYFLQCPARSQLAQYTWYHNERNFSCTPDGQQCVLLIDSMSLEDEGVYRCVSDEEDHVHVRAAFRLQLKSRAGERATSVTLWICLSFVLIKSLSS